MTKRMAIYGGAAMLFGGIMAGVIATLLRLPPVGGMLLGMAFGGGLTFWATGLAIKHDRPAS